MEAMRKRAIGAAIVVATLIVGFVVLVSPAEVKAQDVVYQQHQVVDFGDDTIEGDLSKPDGQYLEARKHLRHPKLIKVRRDFRAEVLQSVRGL